MYNENILASLDKQRSRKIKVRLTSLTFKEERPVEYIEGYAQSGSISVDGSSAVRRTCQIQLITDTPLLSQKNWFFKTKFKVEIGVELESNQEDIWFNQGVFVITSFNSSQSPSSNTVSISGKDKMSLLNGDLSGAINSSVDFGKRQEVDKDGNIRIISIPVKDIVKEAVHQYGGESFFNIVINDLDQTGLELLEYRYDTPVYLLREQGQTDYSAISFGDTPPSNYENVDDPYSETIDTSHSGYFKVEYGQTAGYRETELTYPGDLIASPGETVTSILDKIKNFLGGYEYFYDLDGRFVFQKKQDSYWTPFQNNTSENAYSESYSPYSYTFSGTESFTSFNNTPNISNVKNDFTVWGTRKSVTGNELPVHCRYAIDVKPQRYTSISVSEEELKLYNEKYNLQLKGQQSTKYTTDTYDWRHIIYQMALDYSKYNHLDDFELKVAQANSVDYPNGRTGYEQYYIDLQGFWPELYGFMRFKDMPPKDSVDNWSPAPSSAETKIKGFKSGLFDTKSLQIISYKDETTLTTDKKTAARRATQEIVVKPTKYLITGEAYLKKGLADRKVQIWPNGTESGSLAMIKSTNVTVTDDNNKKIKFKYVIDYSSLKTSQTVKFSIGMAKTETQTDWLAGTDADGKYIDYIYIANLTIDPIGELCIENEAWDTLNYYLDFIDPESELSDFAVTAIGDRAKVVNDSSVKSLFNRRTPNIIYGENKTNKSGYRYFSIPEGYSNMFSISAQGKSGQDAVENLIRNHTYVNQSISINSIPIYYLEPNTRVYINDPNSNINGDYIISKFTLPLSYNGTMSITATKAVEDLL